MSSFIEAQSSTTVPTTIISESSESLLDVFHNLQQFRSQLPVFAYKEIILRSIFDNNNNEIMIDNDNNNGKNDRMDDGIPTTITNNKRKINDISNSNTLNNDHDHDHNRQHLSKVVLITAETGSGKSTQIPSYCLIYMMNQIKKNRKKEKKHKKKYKNLDNNSHHHNYSGNCIAVTQPRRVAAITLARRVAYEYSIIHNNNHNDTSITTTTTAVHNNSTNNNTNQNNHNNHNQNLIGYRVRFDDNTIPNITKLIYITDGMLLREAILDPLLLKYNIIFLDEAHERSLQTDILLGIIENARIKRNSNNSNSNYQPLHIIIMSATIQSNTFIQYFGGINYVIPIHIPGRTFPVQILYTKINQVDYIESTLSTILQIHYDMDDINNNEYNNNNIQKNNKLNGDILVFLPGQEEIEDLANLLKQHLKQIDVDENNHFWTNNNNNHNDQVIDMQAQANNNNNNNNNNNDLVGNVLICLLYAALSPEQQMIAFDEIKPIGCIRKIILATNIAETSVTLPSIKYVIDTGKHKSRYVNNTTGIEYLTIENISQQQALQRTGRAGRVQDGYCFRLYTQETYDNILHVSSIPEILRVNLTQVLLQLQCMGINDPMNFDFITKPKSESIIRSCKILYALNAINDIMIITEYGKQLAILPLDPIYGHLILQSIQYKCILEMLTIVSILSSDHLFYFPPGGNNNIDIDDSSSNGINNNHSKAASIAHKRFSCYEGDLPTYLNVYQSWEKEAIYIPPSSSTYNYNNGSGGLAMNHKMMKKLRKQRQREQENNSSSNNPGGNEEKKHSSSSSLLLNHSEWCQRHFISGRSITRAYAIRAQLSMICSQPIDHGGLGIDVTVSCGKYDSKNNEEGRMQLLKCIASGLFLQAASRINSDDTNSNHTKNRINNYSNRNATSYNTSLSIGKYKTKLGNQNVSIHPTSTLFHRPSGIQPKCVVYTELVTTKKAYIRGCTQIKEDWLIDLAPQFYS